MTVRKLEITAFLRIAFLPVKLLGFLISLTSAALGHHVQKAGVGRCEVVGIGTVVQLHFPVGVVGILDAPWHEFHAVLPLLHGEI